MTVIVYRGPLPSLLLRFLELLLFGLVLVPYRKVGVAVPNVNTRKPKQLLQGFFWIFVCILFSATAFLFLIVYPPKGLTMLAAFLCILLKTE